MNANVLSLDAHRISQDSRLAHYLSAAIREEIAVAQTASEVAMQERHPAALRIAREHAKSLELRIQRVLSEAEQLIVEIIRDSIRRRDAIVTAQDAEVKL